ncbi:MAG: hypothetical protein NDJ24_04690 [Alphaproteobacteria bacterium]|nr:hypothetical protein [Alphaproteobacteria bacterium]
MNIDLLLTTQGDAGLVCDTAAGSPVAGVMFDSDTGQLTLEYADLDPLDLNIPVDDSYIETLYYATSIQVGTIVDGEIRENRQVPILLTNDPQANSDRARFAKPRASALAFESFLKACVKGQPIHRADLSDESSSGSVMGGMSPSILKFAPHLARQKAFEAAPHLAPKGPAPPGLGPGGGRSGGGHVSPMRGRPPPAHRNNDDKDED